MIRRLIVLVWGVALLISGAPAQSALRVVATLPDLAALAAEVGGAHVEVEALAAPSQDPHYVDARPSLVVKLNRAELLIVNGLELEIGWLPALQQTARNPRILAGATGYLDASQVVRPLQIPAGKVDRSMGDIHPGGNPHYLFDARAGAAIAKAIGARLELLDPPHATQYRDNATRLAAVLQTFAGEQTQRFLVLRPEQRRVVSYHRSLAYLFDWLGLEETITLEPRPGIPPDPAHLSRVVTTMRQQATRVLLQEEFYPRKPGQTVAQLVDGTVVLLPGGTRFADGQTYLAHLRALTGEIYHALAR